MFLRLSKIYLSYLIISAAKLVYRPRSNRWWCKYIMLHCQSCSSSNATMHERKCSRVFVLINRCTRVVSDDDDEHDHGTKSNPIFPMSSSYWPNPTRNVFLKICFPACVKEAVKTERTRSQVNKWTSYWSWLIQLYSRLGKKSLNVIPAVQTSSIDFQF